MMPIPTIKKRSTFLKIGKYGIRYRTQNVTILTFREPSLQSTEVGYTASKKVGNAVKRNYAKRRLRSVVHILRDIMRNNYQYVLIANTNTITCQFDILLKDVELCVAMVHKKMLR